MNSSDREEVRQLIEEGIKFKIDTLHQFKHDSLDRQITGHSHCADCGKVFEWNIHYYPMNKWNVKLCRDCNLRHEGPVTEKKK
jgi:hypothetical protein